MDMPRGNEAELMRQSASEFQTRRAEVRANLLSTFTARREENRMLADRMKAVQGDLRKLGRDDPATVRLLMELEEDEAMDAGLAKVRENRDLLAEASARLQHALSVYEVSTGDYISADGVDPNLALENQLRMATKTRANGMLDNLSSNNKMLLLNNISEWFFETSAAAEEDDAELKALEADGDEDLTKADASALKLESQVEQMHRGKDTVMSKWDELSRQMKDLRMQSANVHDAVGELRDSSSQPGSPKAVRKASVKPSDNLAIKHLLQANRHKSEVAELKKMIATKEVAAQSLKHQYMQATKNAHKAELEARAKIAKLEQKIEDQFARYNALRLVLMDANMALPDAEGDLSNRIEQLLTTAEAVINEPDPPAEPVLSDDAVLDEDEDEGAVVLDEDGNPVLLDEEQAEMIAGEEHMQVLRNLLSESLNDNQFLLTLLEERGEIDVATAFKAMAQYMETHDGHLPEQPTEDVECQVNWAPKGVMTWPGSEEQPWQRADGIYPPGYDPETGERIVPAMETQTDPEIGTSVAWTQSETEIPASLGLRSPSSTTPVASPRATGPSATGVDRGTSPIGFAEIDLQVEPSQDDALRVPVASSGASSDADVPFVMRLTDSENEDIGQPSYPEATVPALFPVKSPPASGPVLKADSGRKYTRRSGMPAAAPWDSSDASPPREAQRKPNATKPVKRFDRHVYPEPRVRKARQQRAAPAPISHEAHKFRMVEDDVPVALETQPRRSPVEGASQMADASPLKVSPARSREPSPVPDGSSVIQPVRSGQGNVAGAIRREINRKVGDAIRTAIADEPERISPGRVRRQQTDGNLRARPGQLKTGSVRQSSLENLRGEDARVSHSTRLLEAWLSRGGNKIDVSRLQQNIRAQRDSNESVGAQLRAPNRDPAVEMAIAGQQLSDSVMTQESAFGKKLLRSLRHARNRLKADVNLQARRGSGTALTTSRYRNTGGAALRGTEIEIDAAYAQQGAVPSPLADTARSSRRGTVQAPGRGPPVKTSRSLERLEATLPRIDLLNSVTRNGISVAQRRNQYSQRQESSGYLGGRALHRHHRGHQQALRHQDIGSGISIQNQILSQRYSTARARQTQLIRRQGLGQPKTAR